MSGDPQLPTENESQSNSDRLVRQLDQFDQALTNGVPTEGLERRIIDEFGTSAEPRLRVLKWLHTFTQAKFGDNAAPAGLDADENLSIDALLTFGRFHVIERVGSGGHGVVLRVFDPTLMREAALKIPRPDIVGRRELARRFLKEARATAALNHPQIVPVYDAGQIDGVPYILSAFCHGPNLAQWLSEQRRLGQAVSPRLAVRWMMLIATGVAYAHAKKIAHRDLKPANIMLEPELNCDDTTAQLGSESPAKGAFRPQISDFGLSKFDEYARSPENFEHSSTATGTVLGTLTYMAPEQASAAEDINYFSCDVYALGAILYEMLTGRPPHVAPNPLELLRKLDHDEPPFPRSLRSDIPRDLESICLKSLQREPTKRYHTAHELAGDLDRFLTGERVKATRLTRLSRSLKSLFTLRLPFWVFIILGCVFGLIVIDLTRPSFQSRHEDELTSEHAAAPDATLAEVLATQHSQSEIIASQERSLADAYVLDMNRANRIWQLSRALERDNSYTAAEIKELLKRHIPVPGAIDRRGFEWYYLWRCCEPERFARPSNRFGACTGHTRDVYQVEFTPDCKRLISCGGDKSIRVWSVETQELLQTLIGHTDEVNGFSLSGDAKHLASASDDGTVRIWDMETGTERSAFTGHLAPVVAIAFNQHFPLVYSGDDSGVVKIWDVEKKSELYSIRCHAKRIQSLHRHPQYRDAHDVFDSTRDPYQFITSSDDGYASVWEVGRSKDNPVVPFRQYRFDSSLEFFRSAELSSVRATLSYPRTDMSRVVFFHAENAHRFSFETAGKSKSGCFTACESQFLIGGSEAPIRMVDLATRKSWSVSEGLDVWSLAVSRDGHRFATGEKKGKINLWDCSVMPQEIHVPIRLRRCDHIEYSPDSYWLFASKHFLGGEPLNPKDACIIWDMRQTPPAEYRLENITNPDEPLLRVFGSFSDDCRELVMMSEASGAPVLCRVFDLATRKETRHFSLPVKSIQQLVCSEGRIHCWSFEGNQVQIFSLDSETGRVTSKFSLPALIPRAILSRDGRFFAREHNGRIEVHNVASGHKTLDIHVPFTLNAAGISFAGHLTFSPRSDVLAISGTRGIKRLLRLEDGRVYSEIQGDESEGAFPLCFAKNEHWAITGGGRSRQVEIRSLPEGQLLLSLHLPAETYGVPGFAISPDGKMICAVCILGRSDLATIKTEVPPDFAAEERGMIVWKITGSESQPVPDQ